MTDVFISYSRKDQEFSHWLVHSFEHYQRDVWLDKDDILPTSQWLAEIYAGIEAADNFIFIISPDSLQSQVCGWEVAHAIKHNKRLIPVLRRDVNLKELAQLMANPGWEGMPPEYWKKLSGLNWIMFKQDLDQNQAFWNLFNAVDLDIEYVHQHSSILVEALNWDSGGRKPNDTLRGGTLKKAEQWLSQSGGKDPQPTKLHHEYIKASRAATTKRILVTMFASGFALVALTIASWVAYDQYQSAVTERIAKERKALETWSLDMAAKAQDAFENGNPGLGLNLALAAVDIDNPPLAAEQTLEALAYQRGTVATFASTTLGRFGPDENNIYLAQGNALVQWDLATRSEINRFTLDAPILDFDVSQNGDFILLALEDGSIRGLNISTHSIVDYGPGAPPLELGASGKTFVHVGQDSAPVLRSADTGDEKFRFPSNATISDLSYNESWNRLLVGLGNGEMYLWDTSTGELVHSLNWYDDNSVMLNVVPEQCAQEGTLVAHVALSDDVQYAVYGMSGSVASAVLACRLDEILVWDLYDAQVRVVKHLVGHDLLSGVLSIDISPRGDTILSGGGNELFLWDVKTGRQLQQLPIFSDSVDTYTEVKDVGYDPSGRYALVTTDDRIVRLLDLTPGMQLMKVELSDENLKGNLVQAMALSADGNLVLAGGQWTPQTYPSTRVVDLTTGDILSTFDMHFDVFDLAITPDQKYALEYSSDGLFLTEIATGSVVHGFQTGEINEDSLYWVLQKPLIALSPDGGTVFTQGCLFEVSTGDKRSCYNFGERGLYNSDGSWIISAIGSDTLVVWDPATGQELRRFDPGVRIGPLFALGPDNGELLAGSDSNLVLIDLYNDTVKQSFAGHTGPVYAGDISPDGKLVISGAADATFRIWDAELGIELRQEKQDEWVFGAIFSKDGTTAVSGDHLGRVVRWRMATTLDQLVDWVKKNRDVPEMSCYEKDVYGIKPLCASSDYAWLGLTAVTQAGNAVIESIDPDSPAERAGLETGDIVRDINGNYIQSADQIYKLVEKYRPGDTISFEGYRSSSGEVFKMNITLGQRQ